MFAGLLLTAQIFYICPGRTITSLGVALVFFCSQEIAFFCVQNNICAEIIAWCAEKIDLHAEKIAWRAVKKRFMRQKYSHVR